MVKLLPRSKNRIARDINKLIAMLSLFKPELKIPTLSG